MISVCDKSGHKVIQCKSSLSCSSRHAIVIILFCCSSRDKVIPKDTLGILTVLGLSFKVTACRMEDKINEWNTL